MPIKGFEFVVILIVVLVIFGPTQLPKLAKTFGKSVKNLREGMSEDDAPEAEAVSEEDKEIAELEAKLAAAKQKKEEAEKADEE